MSWFFLKYYAIYFLISRLCQILTALWIRNGLIRIPFQICKADFSHYDFIEPELVAYNIMQLHCCEVQHVEMDFWFEFEMTEKIVPMTSLSVQFVYQPLRIQTVHSSVIPCLCIALSSIMPNKFTPLYFNVSFICFQNQISEVC